VAYARHAGASDKGIGLAGRPAKQNPIPLATQSLFDPHMQFSGRDLPQFGVPNLTGRLVPFPVLRKILLRDLSAYKPVVRIRDTFGKKPMKEAAQPEGLARNGVFLD